MNRAEPNLSQTNIEIPIEQNSVAPGEDFDEYNNDFLKTGIDKAQEPNKQVQ